MTNKQLEKAINKFAAWKAQEKEMEDLKAAIMQELLDRAERQVETPAGSVATYVEGCFKTVDDKKTIYAFYLEHHASIPKVEQYTKAYMKVYKKKAAKQ